MGSFTILDDHFEAKAKVYELTHVHTDPLQLLSSLSLSASAPSTPASNPNPSSTFPFFTSPSQPSVMNTASTASTNGFTLTEPPRTPVSSSSRRDLGRQRSVRTERRREKFGRVLKGRVEDGGGVDLGQSCSPNKRFPCQMKSRPALIACDS